MIRKSNRTGKSECYIPDKGYDSEKILILTREKKQNQFYLYEKRGRRKEKKKKGRRKEEEEKRKKKREEEKRKKKREEEKRKKKREEEKRKKNKRKIQKKVAFKL